MDNLYRLEVVRSRKVQAGQYRTLVVYQGHLLWSKMDITLAGSSQEMWLTITPQVPLEN